MEKLKNCFNFQGQQVVSLIGSGGKTSLMWYLANSHSKEKVLVSTTTKIGYPNKKTYDYFYNQDFSLLGNDGRGITLAGNVVANGKKLSMPPLEKLKNSFSKFDKVFLEADGSKQLPLKGWENFEPVVLGETTVTISVFPISVIGKKADGDTVHRLPIFLKMTGMEQGEEITEKSLALIISSSFELGQASRGERILCFNQVEKKQQLQQVETIVSLLPLKCLESLTKIIACSVKKEEGVILWEKTALKKP